MKRQNDISPCEAVGYRQENEQLKKEKKWLINKVSVSYFTGYSPLASERKKDIIRDMQQALKEEEVREYDNKGNPKDLEEWWDDLPDSMLKKEVKRLKEIIKDAKYNIGMGLEGRAFDILNKGE